jgi:SWI/SNF-related matrix-associated actin-dependent regulator of chromatin subfamily A-like protein 1
VQIQNKFAKACCTCGTMVKEFEGFAAKRNGGPWRTYCKDHAPEQIIAKPVITERKLDVDGWIVMPYEPANIPILKSMPGAVYNHPKRDDYDPARPNQWRVSLREEDRMRVLEIADRLGLNVAPELRQLAPANHAQLPDTLYPFQKIGVEWLSRRDKAILGDDMGLGKTIQTLVALEPQDRVLVVCPASLKYNWQKEIQTWRPDFTPYVVNAQDKKIRIPKPGEIVIINYEILPSWLLLPREQMPEAVSRFEGITLIGDEVHFLSHHKTQRSQKMNALREHFSRKVLYLTGTLMTRDPGSLWTVLRAADLAHEAFGSWGRFLKLFNAQKKSRYGGIEWGQPDPIVPELLRRVMLRRTRQEVLPDLPQKIYTDLLVNGISATLKSDMDALWSEQGDFLEVEQGLPNFEEYSKIRNQLASAKIPALLERVELHEEQGIPLVVASDHTAPVDAVGARPGWAVIKGGVPHEERQRIVEAFNNGSLKGVALTITAGGVGLNLQHAWKMVMVDLNWTPANNLQCMARIERIGQKSSKIEIERLIVNHPLERHIHNIVARKTAMNEAAVEQLMQAQQLAPPVPPSNPVQSETPEEYQARMESLAREQARAERDAALAAAVQTEEVIRARAKGKVSVILERERVRSPRQEKPLTPTRIASIRDGIKALASVCDGAIARDNQGFNKPDAYTGKVLSLAGLEDESELRAAEYILMRYPRQWTLDD